MMLKIRGFSLLEVCVAMVLLAVSIFGLQSMYINLLSANLKSDGNQEVVATFDTLVEMVRYRVRTTWPPGPPPDPALTWTGTFGKYTYNVDDSGRLLDPMDSTGTGYLKLKKVTVTMDYPDPRSDKIRTIRAVISVAR